VKTAAIVSQVCLIIAGLALSWKLVFSPAAQTPRAPSPLPAWDASLQDIITYFLHALSGGFLCSFVLGVCAKPLGLTGDGLTVASTAAMHFGALCGLGVFLSFNPRARPLFGAPRAALVSGIATFLISMPFVAVTNVVWLQLLELAGYDVQRQPAVEMVGRLVGSPWMIVFVLFAVVAAPIAEELLFRAGLYRYLRSRRKKVIALGLPALLFAAVHFHVPSYVPLAVLGILFSLAYERTGAIGTAIVAHGAFNLNNLLLLLAGAGK
jgi:uncharacterized protein